MNLAKALVCCAIVAAPMVSMADDPAMNNPCANIKWSLSFLKHYPRAPAACQTVEEKDGAKYAKFTGKVASVDASGVQVAVNNVAGTSVAMIQWQAAPSEAMVINDKEATVGDLKKGDKLTFWIQEGKFTISLHPGQKPLPFGKATHIPQS